MLHEAAVMRALFDTFMLCGYYVLPVLWVAGIQYPGNFELIELAVMEQTFMKQAFCASCAYYCVKVVLIQVFHVAGTYYCVNIVLVVFSTVFSATVVAISNKNKVMNKVLRKVSTKKSV